jgi:hypothetical protein
MEGAFEEEHRGNQLTRKEVWAPPEPEEEDTGGLRVGAAGAPAALGSTSPLRSKG